MAEYIERERALEELKYSGCGSAYRELATRRIMAIPAANVAPVIHGRWEYCPNLGIAVCTECGFERDVDSNFGSAISCPNCGAKMDKEDHDGH